MKIFRFNYSCIFQHSQNTVPVIGKSDLTTVGGVFNDGLSLDDDSIFRVVLGEQQSVELNSLVPRLVFQNELSFGESEVLVSEAQLFLLFLLSVSIALDVSLGLGNALVGKGVNFGVEVVEDAGVVILVLGVDAVEGL